MVINTPDFMGFQDTKWRKLDFVERYDRSIGEGRSRRSPKGQMAARPFDNGVSDAQPERSASIF